MPQRSRRSAWQRGYRSGNAAQGILEDPGGDLHGAYLASAGADLFGQAREALPGGVAHRYFGMPHPACVGGPTWSNALSRLKAALDGFDDPGEAGSAERAPTGMAHLANNPRRPKSLVVGLYGRIEEAANRRPWPDRPDCRSSVTSSNQM
jgi:hypothetical protein